MFAAAALALTACGCTRGCRVDSKSVPNPMPGDHSCTESLLDRQLTRYARSEQVVAAAAAMKRSLVFDVVFPADEEQLRAMNAMAIVGVRVLSTYASDFPVHSVAFLPEGEKRRELIRLPLAGRRVRAEDRRLDQFDGKARKFGDYGEEVYALIPIRYLATQGELVVRLAKDGLVSLTATRLPIRFRLPFLDGKEIPGPDPGGRPDQELITQLVKRYYCI